MSGTKDHDSNDAKSAPSGPSPPPRPPMSHYKSPEEFFAARDEEQRNLLKQQEEEITAKLKRKEGDAPPDLMAFIKDENFQIKEVTINTAGAPRRLPRHLRDDNDEDNGIPSKDDDDGKSTGPISQKMPLMERVQGFDTVRTTNFSSRRERVTAKIYKAADVVDIYKLLQRKQPQNSGEETNPEISLASTSSNKNTLDAVTTSTNTTSPSFSSPCLTTIVYEVYQEYGQKHALPSDEFQQMHKELLHNTLKYLTNPVLLRDEETGSFHGAAPDHFAELQMTMFGGNTDSLKRVPRQVAKFVVQDLADSQYGPPSSPPGDK